MNAADIKSENLIKWTLPLILIIGYILTFRYFNQTAFEYAVFSISALSASLLFITYVDIREENTNAAWMAVLLFFTVYLVRFYWIAIDPTPVKLMLPENPYRTMVQDRDGLAQAFRLTVVSFIGLSLSIIWALKIINRDKVLNINKPRKLLATDYGQLPSILIFISIPVMFFLAYITYQYRIGEMGSVSSDKLPFRLKGIVFYARTVVFPLTMLYVVFLSERNGNYFLSRAAVLLLVTHGFADMLLRNSRSSFLLSILLLVFLAIAGGYKARPWEKMLCGCLIVFGLFIVPIMTQYRMIRTQLEISHLDAIWAAVSSIKTDWYLQVFAGIKFTLFRLPGIESLWCMVSWGGIPLGEKTLEVIGSKDGIAGYLTQVIYPLKESDNTLLAPGFVGWFYLIDGYPAVFIGAIATGLLLIAGWKYLGSSYLQVFAVAQAFFLWIVFLAITEGTLDSMVRMFVVGVLSVGGFEVLTRLWLRRKNRLTTLE